MSKLPRRVEPAGEVDEQDQYYEYSPQLIGGLILAYVLGLAALTTHSIFLEGLGGLAVLAVAVGVLVLDGRAVLTLRGRVASQRPSGCVTAVVIFFLWPFAFFWVIPYLAIAARDTLQAGSRRELERQRRIAELEARLGLLPSEAGTCPSCGKPLQAGAEFCAYCGERPTAPLRVCSACGTRTFPDANWCPSCGAVLPPITAR